MKTASCGIFTEKSTFFPSNINVIEFIVLFVPLSILSSRNFCLMVIFSAQKKSRKFREIIFMKKFREIDKRNTKTMLCSKLLLILQEIKFWDS